MPQEGPGCCAEEGVGLDVRGASARAEATQLVFDEQFTDQGFAKAVMVIRMAINS